jgi:BirA family biotin operon repressor/biotin-[acetyl-CoA-carboxylase] ligase
VKQNTPSKLNINKTQEKLQTEWLGQSIFFTHLVRSTNDWAKKLAELGANEGTVTIAETQTSGRGRIGRTWISPIGGLYFSVILRPKLKPAETIKLVFVASLAIVDALKQLHGLKAKTKWPNDVLIDGRKVCGILSEMKTNGEQVKYAVLGIGINANFDVEKVLPEQLRENATSLAKELGTKVDLNELLKATLEKLESVYDLFLEKGFAPVLSKWKQSASFLGKQVEVRNEDEKLRGSAVDVDESGSLILRLNDGVMKHVFIGDVSLHVE